MAKMVIKRLGVFSVAKIYAVVMAGVGLLIGIPLGLLMIIFGAAMMTAGRDSAAGAGVGGGLGIGMGIFYMIGLPIMEGVFGFIFGALGALIYNMAAGIIGGVEMELENADAGYAPPPQPQWGAQQQQYQPGQQQYPY
jgi:hypothetical protein